MDERELSERIDISIRARMARQVLPGPSGEIDARTGFVLKIANVLTRDLPNQMPDQVLEVLLDPNHPHRLSAETDPALVFRATEHEHHFAELEVALLNPDSRVRNAVLDELHRKLSSVPQLCSEKVSQTIQDAGRHARSVNPNEYLPACVKIHDALKSDVLYSLALLRQAGAAGALESALEYLNRLLRPAQRGLNCFEELGLIRTLSGALKLSTLLSPTVNSESVEECLSQYFAVSGFLPLTGANSCGTVLSTWKSAHPNHDISWQNLADWADQNTSSLAQYQICQAVVRNQDLIDDASSENINSRINSIFAAGDTDNLDDSWVLRHRLARYYSQYLTCEFAAGDTERMAICAWWLADKLTSALHGATNRCREHCIQQISDIVEANEELWLMVQPGGEPSVLFSATMQHRRLWSESLTAEIATSLVESGSTKLLPSTVSNMTKIAVSGALFPHGTGRHTDGLKYSFELDALPFVNEMLKVLGDREGAENLWRIVGIAETARNTTESNDSIRRLPELDDDVARVVGFALQKSAYAGGAPVQILWECISDPKWRRALVHSRSDEGFSLFCETLIRLQATLQNEDWRIRLPHFFAAASVEDGGTDERKTALVSYCIVSSIAGGCTSAIERLIASQHNDILKLLQHWHARLDQIIRFARPLAAARLRPVKQSLSAATLASQQPMLNAP